VSEIHQLNRLFPARPPLTGNIFEAIICFKEPVPFYREGTKGGLRIKVFLNSEIRNKKSGSFGFLLNVCTPNPPESPFETHVCTPKHIDFQRGTNSADEQLLVVQSLSW